MNGLGHHVRGVVADQFQRFGVVAGEDLDARIRINRFVEIGERAVKLTATAFLASDFEIEAASSAPVITGIVVTDRGVGEGQSDHDSSHSRLHARVSCHDL